MRISHKVKGVKMQNLLYTIFHMKINILSDFYICISVPLMIKYGQTYLKNYAM